MVIGDKHYVYASSNLNSMDMILSTPWSFFSWVTILLIINNIDR